MNFTRRLACGLSLGLLLAGGAALAQEHGTKEEAIALTDRAWEHVKKVGKEQAFQDFSNDKANWTRKDLYVVVSDFNGVTLAHGGNARLVGKSMLGVKDANGLAFITKLIEAAQSPAGNGWVNYDWPHPQTKKIEGKSTYVRKMPDGDGFVGVGIYR